MTDAEIYRIARTLHAQGVLTNRTLAELAKGDAQRLAAIVRDVLEEESDASAGAETPAHSDIPAWLRGELSHLHKSITKALLQVREEEHNRARLLEAAQAKQHEDEIKEAHDATGAAQQGLEQEQERLAAAQEAITQLSLELQGKTSALESANAERRSYSEAAARERESTSNAIAELQRSLALAHTDLKECNAMLGETRLEVEKALAANALLRAQAESARSSAHTAAEANAVLRDEIANATARLEAKDHETIVMTDHIRELTRVVASIVPSAALLTKTNAASAENAPSQRKPRKRK
jgi:chromosome segregation ATPase